MKTEANWSQFLICEIVVSCSVVACHVGMRYAYYNCYIDLQYCYCSWVLGKLIHLAVAFSILVSYTIRSNDSDETDQVNMESNSDTTAQPPILDREVSNVESW